MTANTNTQININALKAAAFDAVDKGNNLASSGTQSLAYLIMMATEQRMIIDAKELDLARWYQASLDKSGQLDDDTGGIKAVRTFLLTKPAFDKGEGKSDHASATLKKYRARNAMLTRALELAGALTFAGYSSPDFDNGNPPNSEIATFRVKACDIFNMKGKKFASGTVREVGKKRRVNLSATILLNGASYTANMETVATGNEAYVTEQASIASFIASVSEVKKKKSGQGGNIADKARSLGNIIAEATKGGAYLSGGNVPLLRSLLNSLLSVKVEQRDEDGTVNVVPLTQWAAPVAPAAAVTAEAKAA